METNVTATALYELVSNTSSLSLSPDDVIRLLQSGVLYHSTTELIALVLTMQTMILISTVGNGFAIRFIIGDAKLQPAQKATLIIKAGCELIHLLIWYSEASTVVIQGDTRIFTNYRLACCLERTLLTGLFLGNSASIAVIALERLLFFKYPYVYDRLISAKTIILLEFGMYSLAFVINGIACTIGRSYYSVTTMMCSLYLTRWYFPTAMCLFIIPSGIVELLMVIIVMHQIITMKQKRSNVVCPSAKVHPVVTARASPAGFCRDGGVVEAGNETSTSAPSAGEGKPGVPRARQLSESPTGSADEQSREVIQVMSTAVKLVGSTSLTYWLFYFPAMIVIFHVLKRVTLLDMELGKARKYANLMRAFIWFGLGLVRVTNPFFYFTFIPSLRHSLFKAFRLRFFRRL